MVQKLYVSFFSGLFCLFITGNYVGDKNMETTRILFIGNSYTYYNSMPQLFKSISEHQLQGHQIEIDLVAAGGATLRHHWENGKALEKIRSEKWDFVVLQEQSMLGTAINVHNESYFGTPEPFFEYARKFDRVIRNHGAETVFFMTWSRQDYKQQQKYLTYAYMSIAEELNSKIAPVGMVWDKLKDSKNFNLYMKDGAHPSVHGSFLSATLLFAIIFDTRPAGIRGRLEGYKILRGGNFSREKTLLCQIPDADVKIIQDTTAAIYEQMKKENGYPEVEKAVSEREISPLSFIFSRLKTAEGQFFIFIFMLLIYAALKAVQASEIRNNS